PTTSSRSQRRCSFSDRDKCPVALVFELMGRKGRKEFNRKAREEGKGDSTAKAAKGAKKLFDIEACIIVQWKEPGYLSPLKILCSLCG
ncbi:MAG: hypothetical protein AB7H86_19440, partial [Blastocatellales bacterium]